MRSLATLGGLIVILALAVAWKISNQVEAGQEPDPDSGLAMVGILPPEQEPDAAGPGGTAPPGGSDPASAGNGAGAPGSGDPASDPRSGDPNADPGADDPDPAAGSSDPSAYPGGSDPASGEQGTGESGSDPAGAQAVRYQVQDNDTLYSILLRAYGKASEDLIDRVAMANGMDDPSNLGLGQELVLPVFPGYSPPKLP